MIRMTRSGRAATQGKELSTLDDRHSKFDVPWLLRAGFCLLATVTLCSPAAWGKKPAGKHAQAKPPAHAPVKKVPNPWLVPATSKLDLSAGVDVEIKS